MQRNVSSLYIHFPFCKHLCNYCDFYKLKIQDINNSGDSSLIIDYQNYLQESFIINQELLNKNDLKFIPLETLYIGGGTPSLWGMQGSKFVSNFLGQNKLNFANDYEFTIEVNPGGWCKEEIESWLEMGVNRFSVGIQTLDENLLIFLDRVHTLNDSIETLNFFSKLKINYSVDLMLGLPNSKKFNRNILYELEKIISYRPSHFSIYILTTKPNYKYIRELPEEEWVEEEYLKMSDFLSQKGYKQYEVSNFALDGFHSKHNFKYWNGSSIAALGPSAVGFLKLEKEKALRYKWHPRSKQNKILFEREDLGIKELSLEYYYLRLRTSSGLGEEDFKDQGDFREFSRLANNWVDRNMANYSLSTGKWVLTSKGMLMMDSLMSELFGYLKCL